MNEQTIQMIAQAIIANTKVLQSLVDSLPQEVAQQVAKAADVAPSAPVAQPVATPEPAPAPVVEPAPVAAAPAMPAPPTFAEAPAAPAAAAAPFTDSKGLIDYVMGVYKIIGPAKGAGIQNVLTSLGYQNINDIKPEHYGALYAGVEALKG